MWYDAEVQFISIFMEKKKLSLGIDLDAQLKSTIAKTLKPWKDLPVRWHKPESYHIPLVRLGWVNEDAINGLLSDLEHFAQQHETLDLVFEKIIMHYHAKDPVTPQYIRLQGEESPELRLLYGALLDMLNIGHGEIKQFVPYVSLGHVRSHAWKEQDIHPEITQDFHVLVDVMALTLFEEDNLDGKRCIRPMDVFALK